MIEPLLAMNSAISQMIDDDSETIGEIELHWDRSDGPEMNELTIIIRSSRHLWLDMKNWEHQQYSTNFPDEDDESPPI